MAGFAIAKDIELIGKGTHFFCRGHLSARPLTDRSDNPEYCQWCWRSIKSDTVTYSRQSRVAVAPKPVLSQQDTPATSANAVPKINTPNDTRRGRPNTNVPKALVLKMHRDGKSIRKIVASLKIQNFNVSAMTISRMIKSSTGAG